MLGYNHEGYLKKIHIMSFLKVEETCWRNKQEHSLVAGIGSQEELH